MYQAEGEIHKPAKKELSRIPTDRTSSLIILIIYQPDLFPDIANYREKRTKVAVICRDNEDLNFETGEKVFQHCKVFME